ncbi:MAG: hypothetical protein RL607_1327 [Bacteroidota bacterium]|jgi:putative endonuclease
MIEYTEGYFSYYVYILTNSHRNTFYIGVTNNLPRRLSEHQNKSNPNSFTARYSLFYLVYYEKYSWIQLAIEREKELKKWNRTKKIDLIRSFNSDFEFLNDRFQQNLIG